LMRAIELNGAAVDMNKQAFLWGRMAAHDLARVEAALAADAALVVELPMDDLRLSGSLEELVQRRIDQLTDYQDAAYAERYRALVQRVRDAEARVLPGQHALTEAVARYAYKLMAFKDEYEVARLYTNGGFRRRLEQTFEGDY